MKQILKYIPYCIIGILSIFLILNYFSNDIKLNNFFEKGDNYYISVIYFKNIKLNNFFEKNIQTKIKEFKETTEELKDISNAYLVLDINQEIFNYSKDIITIKTNTYQNTGGAHGNTFIDTITLNTKTNKIIKTEDIFKDINKLSQTIKSNIISYGLVPEDALFEEGLKPDYDNFKNFSLHQDYITFYFSPYEVAAYVFGPIEVVLTQNQLKEIADLSILNK